jgi:fluoride exporter
MMAALAVFVGGGLGALARWGLALLVARSPLAGSPWPVATLAANLAGGVLIGILTALLVRQAADDPVRLFAVTGLLGGFTTFSAFSLEVWRMLEAGNWTVAALYVGLSVCVAVAAVGAGLAIGQRLA